MFPEAVATVYTSDKFAPITLSGIVKQDTEGKITTTELPVAFTFHTPFLTPDGANTTLAIAAGPDVSVNLILGLPFIKATGCVLDVNNNVARFDGLDCSPLEIIYRRARVEIPSEQLPQTNLASVHRDFIADLETMERSWASAYVSDSSSLTESSSSGSKRARADVQTSAPETALVPYNPLFPHGFLDYRPTPNQVESRDNAVEAAVTDDADE